MKELGVYTLYDTVAGEGGPLFTARNDDEGKRIARETLKNIPFGETDFVLYKIGTYIPEALGQDEGDDGFPLVALKYYWPIKLQVSKEEQEKEGVDSSKKQ